jgi:hypothetical protein
MLPSAFALPVLAAAWFGGPRTGVFVTVVGAAAHAAVHASSAVGFGTVVLLAVGTCVSLAAGSARRQVDDRVAAASRLTQALAVVRTMRGQLPFCTHCRRVEDKEAWEPLDAVVERRTLATLVHRRCPDCDA